MSYGMPMDNAQDAPFAERSVRMWPFECGGSEERWGDRGIGSLENINGKRRTRFGKKGSKHYGSRT